MLFKESVDGPEENPPPLAMNNFHFKNPFFPAYPQIFIHNRCGLFRLKRVEIKDAVNGLFDNLWFIHVDFAFFQGEQVKSFPGSPGRQILPRDRGPGCRSLFGTPVPPRDRDHRALSGSRAF